MIITYIGMASIFLGFLCVMGAFWLFHNREDSRGPIVLGNPKKMDAIPI